MIYFYNAKFIPLATTSFMFSIKSSISLGVTIILYSPTFRASLTSSYLSSCCSLFKYSFDSAFSCSLSINMSIPSDTSVASSTTVGIRSCNSRSVYVLVTLNKFQINAHCSLFLHCQLLDFVLYLLEPFYLSMSLLALPIFL